MAKKSSKPSTLEIALKNAHLWVAPFPEIRRQQNDNCTSFYIGEVAYATVELVDAHIHIKLQKPMQLNEDLTARLVFYKQEHKDGKNWLLFSTPADNKPGPALEAGIGRFAGTMLRQLREQLGVDF